MNWLEDAQAIYEELKAFEATKVHRLSVKSIADIQDDITEIESVSIQHDFDGLTLSDVLSSFISRAPQLKKIHIFPKITWNDVCRLDLSHIEELSFVLDGEPSNVPIIAPVLRSLTVFGEAKLTPIELMLADTPHIDFSGMTKLEKLELRHFQLISTEDFKSLHNLKRLTITDSVLSDLSWLSDAEYSLEYLFFDGELENCSGITSQPELKTVYLLHTAICDVSPFKKLPNLQKLDLRYGALNSEGELRRLKLDELLITRRDGDISSVRRKVFDLVRYSVMRVIADEKQSHNIEGLPEFRKRMMLQRMRQPFEEKMKWYINYAFKSDLERFAASDYHLYSSLSKDEFVEIYKSMALSYCPFLK